MYGVNELIDKVMIKYGAKKLIDRQFVTIRTGDETADMIITDLEKRLNASADELERCYKLLDNN